MRALTWLHEHSRHPTTSRLKRYGDFVTSYDLIKAVAILLMVIDHFGYFFFPEQLPLRLIGRGSAPLFFFLIGYSNSQRINWAWPIYGAVLTLISYFNFHQYMLNILINFFCIRLILIGWTQWQKKHPLDFSWLLLAGLYIVLFMISIFAYQYLEYGGEGLMFAITGLLARQKHPALDIWFALNLFTYYVMQNLVFGFYKHPPMNFLFFFILGMQGIVFCTFKNAKFEWSNPFRVVTQILARYSLEFYAIHLLFFELLILFATLVMR